MNNEIKIQKGIPRPKAKRTLSGVSATMRQLEVGDSFVGNPASRGNYHTLAKSIGIKISTHLEENGGLRVWRVDDTD